jgi:hypothetical protein
MDTEILDLLDNFNYRSISEISSVQTCDFSTPYKPFIMGMYKHVKNIIKNAIVFKMVRNVTN